MSSPKDMDFEQAWTSFNEAQFLADFVSADLEDDRIYDSFLQRIHGGKKKLWQL